jgi:hypothetical protein
MQKNGGFKMGNMRYVVVPLRKRRSAFGESFGSVSHARRAIKEYNVGWRISKKLYPSRAGKRIRFKIVKRRVEY